MGNEQGKTYATPPCAICAKPMAAAKHQDTAHWVCPNPLCPNPTRPFSKAHPGRSFHNISHFNDDDSLQMRAFFTDENTVCQTLYTLTSGSPPNLSEDLKTNLLSLHSFFDPPFGFDGGRGKIWYDENLHGEQQFLQHSLELLTHHGEWSPEFFAPYYHGIQQFCTLLEDQESSAEMLLTVDTTRSWLEEELTHRDLSSTQGAKNEVDRLLESHCPGQNMRMNSISFVHLFLEDRRASCRERV